MIKEFIRKLVLGKKSSSKAYIEWMRQKGARIGERTTIFSTTKTLIDMTRPWLIDIGNDVQITEGVTILTHGYDWSVLKGVYGEVLGSSGKVKIGNNVFIGVKTTILKGVHIGNNVIIGANSLVNKDIPDNCVAAGNPARVIMSIDDYHKKRQSAQIQEATELVREYREVYGREVSETELSEFFWLFTNVDEPLPECWDKKMKLVGNYEVSRRILKEHEKSFPSLEEFLSHVDD